MDYDDSFPRLSGYGLLVISKKSDPDISVTIKDPFLVHRVTLLPTSTDRLRLDD